MARRTRDLKEKIKKSRPSLRRVYGENLDVFVQFVLLTQTILHAFLYPIVGLAVGWVMKLSGYRYLTAENFFRFLRHPLVIISGLILIAAALFAELVWLGGVICLVHQSALGIHMDLLQTIAFSLRQAMKATRRKQRWILLFLAPSVLFIHAVRLFTAFRTFISESTWRRSSSVSSESFVSESGSF